MRQNSLFAVRRAAADSPLLLAGRSRRPRHLAAALLEGSCGFRAVDHLGDLEQIVRRRALSLRFADEQRREKLVLAGAVEGWVRPERDFGRQMKVLERLGHVE